MFRANGIAATGHYDPVIFQNKKNPSAVKAQKAETRNQEVKSGESGLSDKAKAFLEKLRKEYGDYDFVVADSPEDQQSLADQSDKEFSVMMSGDELEKMAADETYARKRMDQVDEAVNMAKRIKEEFDPESIWGKDRETGVLDKMTIRLNDNGTLTLFASLEKTNEGKPEQVKKTVLEASSEEEFLQKIRSLDWEQIRSQQAHPGRRFDVSV